MTIDIKIFDIDGVRVFQVSGRVDSITAIQLGEQIQRAINRDVVQLVLDLSRVDYLTSAGVREIIRGQQAAAEEGGDLRLAGPSQPVNDVLYITGLHNELDIYDSREEAVQSFA